MTPPPESPETETLEEIAQRIADNYVPYRSDWRDRKRMESDILEALRNERERCAKVADRYVADMRSVKQRTEYGEGCLNAAVYIAKAIREGK